MIRPHTRQGYTRLLPWPLRSYAAQTAASRPGTHPGDGCEGGAGRGGGGAAAVLQSPVMQTSAAAAASLPPPVIFRTAAGPRQPRTRQDQCSCQTWRSQTFVYQIPDIYIKRAQVFRKWI